MRPSKVPVISAERPETLTQAYHAGILIAQIENYLPREEIPGVATCMVHFQALRELLGERLWQKVKTRHMIAPRVRVYEAFTYQMHLPREMIGNSRDFCLGYAHSYKNSRLKMKTDKLRKEKASEIISHAQKLL
jgi:hypothetical protein